MTPYSADDCCLSVCLPADAVPVLYIDADDADNHPDLDALAQGALNWPVVYWSNGTITGGLDP